MDHLGRSKSDATRGRIGAARGWAARRASGAARPALSDAAGGAPSVLVAQQRSGAGTLRRARDDLGRCADLSDRPASLDVWKVLHRTPIAAAALCERQTTRRYEWPRPVPVAHRRLLAAKFTAGHWRPATARSAQPRSRQDRRHRVCDDHTRLAYCELHAAENAATVSATLKRAALWLSEQAAGSQAVMSTTRGATHQPQFRDTLAELTPHIMPTPRGGRAGRSWRRRRRRRRRSRPRR